MAMVSIHLSPGSSGTISHLQQKVNSLVPTEECLDKLAVTPVVIGRPRHEVSLRNHGRIRGTRADPCHAAAKLHVELKLQHVPLAPWITSSVASASSQRSDQLISAIDLAFLRLLLMRSSGLPSPSTPSESYLKGSRSRDSF